MASVTSKDGTQIVYDKVGTGPALIQVLGAFNDRTSGAALARALEGKFTVYNYDRRGRGESGDTPPYAVEREIEDLDALIQAAGRPVFVFGHSSGATLTLRAAYAGAAFQKMALYEPPPSSPKAAEFGRQIGDLVANGQRGEAVEFFLGRVMNMPQSIIEKQRNSPYRPYLEKMAHTLVYEMALLEPVPNGMAASIKIPAVVFDGGTASSEVMREAAKSLAHNLPTGRSITLEGQGHAFAAEVIAPELEKFFLGS